MDKTENSSSATRNGIPLYSKEENRDAVEKLSLFNGGYTFEGVQ